jgi:hypothetical protein
MTPEEREAAALEWIAPYSYVRYLLRTRDWAVELCPQPPEALVLAALTHDIERHFPEAALFDPGSQAPADFEYRWQHSMRSAQFVHHWLYHQRATDDLVAEVETLILLHEFGGGDLANVLQAADSLSFLETNADLVAGWARDGLCSPERAREQHRWMHDRIRLPAARDAAAPLLERALARVDGR